MRNDPDERSQAYYKGYDAGRRQGVKAFAEYLAETCWTIVQREKLPSFATVFLADAVGGGDEEEIEDEGNGNTDLPTSCECDNTHEQNGTVCRFCYEEDDDMSERDAKLLRKVGGAE